MSLQIKKFTFSPLQENTYILFDETKECIIVDPGCYNTTEETALCNFIEMHQLKPVLLLNTHAHIDHIFGNHFVKIKYQIPFGLHSDDIPLFERAEAMAKLWNLNYSPSPLPDFDLKNKREIAFGSSELEIRFAPGHAPGHVIFYHSQKELAVVGDTVFKGSIGRTDLPWGDHQTLLNSIQNQIFTLPDSTILYSGHGPETTVISEKQFNPFFQHG